METVNFKPNSNKLLVKKDEKVETTAQTEQQQGK
jgi:hypothetical protein